MKLVFLSEYYDSDDNSLSSEENLGIFDDFIIYNHGPFSREVMESFDSLKEKDLIEETTELTYSGDRRKVITLTVDGYDGLSETKSSDEIEEIISDFCNESGSELEERSLELLGITRKDKPNYRFRDVSEIISS